ncbi:TPA: TerD family protein [Clostridioides difficile]|nr:TerD family protein [Clostridioides difficile]HBG0565897.1 TerD family protein [Clostridioides difficile]HBG0787513.1 TerD family protein [Clostridioides difficile]HBG2801211.1 TerD family protein [Clostridioides difficile]
MSVSLQKGQRVSLVKDNNPVKNLVVGLGWDMNKLGKKNYDLDAFAIALTNQDKMNVRGDLVYFGNLKPPSKAIIHTGDNLTGKGEGDDEQIIVNLEDIPEYVHKIVFGVSIYKAKKRDQDFGQINNSFIRLIDSNSKQELFKYNLQEDFSGKVTVLAGEIYRRNEEWKFNALGIGQNEELRELINTYK